MSLTSYRAAPPRVILRPPRVIVRSEEGDQRRIATGERRRSRLRHCSDMSFALARGGRWLSLRGEEDFSDGWETARTFCPPFSVLRSWRAWRRPTLPRLKD